MSLSEQYRRDEELNARLTILKAVHEEHDHQLNDALIKIRLDYFGHRKTKDWVRTQLRAMASLGVVTLRERGTAMVAVITETGIDHVERRAIVEGIAKPGPES